MSHSSIAPVKIHCIAFDCFGTLFDMSPIPQEQIEDYVRHVRSDNFTSYAFPEAWRHLKPFPDVPDGILRLRMAGFTCIALSNGSVELIDRISSGFRFDYIADLAAEKVYKPHIDAYRVVQKYTGFKPAETLMVTANPTFGDIEGAAAIGMPSQVIRHGRPNTVIELAEMLGA